jgi:hypothetical protein
MGSYFDAAGRGALAGIVASVIQVGVGWALDALVLPKRQHNNIAPRLMKRLAQWSGRRGRAPRDWTLGTLFHLGYGMGWGVLLGSIRHATQAPPLPIGAAISGLIYLIAFSGKGIGTLTSTEPPPSARGWRKQVSLVAVASTFGLVTAWMADLHHAPSVCARNRPRRSECPGYGRIVRDRGR